MPRLLDSSASTAASALGYWLDTLLDSELRSIRVQAGYADRKSLNYLCSRLSGQGIELVRLVLGGNQASLTADAALAALFAAKTGRDHRSGLRVVSYSNALFHPKVFHVERVDGSTAAYIGSANFTEAALGGRNFEVGLLLDTVDGDAAELLSDVAEATDFWFADPAPDGVVVVKSAADVTRLTEAGVLQPAYRARDADADAARRPGVKRRPVWTSRRTVPISGPKAGGEGMAPALWWKKLSASDAQRPPNLNTNPTGKLRLSKSQLNIDPKTFFRDEFFGDLPWRMEQRGSNVYECTSVTVKVTVFGVDYGLFDLHVDHAPHRIAAQNNIPTVLAWGPLGAVLRERNCNGAFIVISRGADGQFGLAIQKQKPNA